MLLEVGFLADVEYWINFEDDIVECAFDPVGLTEDPNCSTAFIRPEYRYVNTVVRFLKLLGTIAQYPFKEDVAHHSKYFDKPWGCPLEAPGVLSFEKYH